MSTPESRAREAYDEAQRSKISGPSLVKPDGMARESQGEVDQLRTELARLQSRLEECEKERDELRLDLGRVYGDIGLFAKAQFGLSDNLPTKETFNKMAVGIASIREGLTETIAAIKTLLPIAEGETWDWTQKRIDESIAEAEQLRDIGVAALALSPTTLHGMAVVPAKELKLLHALKDAAIKTVRADTYVHPMLSREDAVKAGVADLHKAVSKWDSAQPPSAARSAGGNAT